MAQYYLAVNGQQLGPFEVNQLIPNGMTQNSFVWTEGMPSWAPASSIPELANLFVAPAAPAAPASAPQPVQQPQYQQPAPQPVQQPQYQQPAPQPAQQPRYQQPAPQPAQQPQYQQPAPQPQYQQPYQQTYQQQPTGKYVATPQLGFMDAVKRCFKKYFDFNGRARRSEFWWFYLATYVINGILYVPINILMSKKNQLIHDALTGKISMAQADSQDPTTLLIIFCIIMGIVSLALLIPMLSATARRLHDVGKSGHLQWLYLLCGIGVPICLILCIPDGKPEPNKYGESPKYVLQQ